VNLCTVISFWRDGWARWWIWQVKKLVPMRMWWGRCSVIISHKKLWWPSWTIQADFARCAALGLSTGLCQRASWLSSSCGWVWSAGVHGLPLQLQNGKEVMQAFLFPPHPIRWCPPSYVCWFILPWKLVRYITNKNPSLIGVICANWTLSNGGTTLIPSYHY